MKIYKLLLIIFLIPPLFGEIRTLEYSTDISYNSDPQNGYPIDIQYYTPAIPNLQLPGTENRLSINFVAGLSPYYIKGGLKFKFIWDTDSVGPGAHCVIKVVAETDSAFHGDPDYGGNHEIYSAYGFQAGISVQLRTLEFSPPFNFYWGPWIDTPVGIGLDACLNIKADGILPMEGDDSLVGWDQLDLVSIGADIAAKQAVKDPKGNPVPKEAESDLLGLLNVLSLQVGLGYMIKNGNIYAKIIPLWPFSLDPAYYNRQPYFMWRHSGDTVSIHVIVDPLSTNNDTGFFRIADGYLREEIYSNGGISANILGMQLPILSSDSLWDPVRNGYEDLVWDDEFPLVPIPITGESQAHVDLYITKGYLSMWHPIERQNHLSFGSAPEVGGVTGVGIKVYNRGNIPSNGYIVKFIFPDTTYVEDRRGFVTIPPGGHDDVSWAGPEWTHPGREDIYVVIIPDSTEHDPNPTDDTLHIRVNVRKHRVMTLIAFIDQATGDTITPSNSVFSWVTASSRSYYEIAVPDTTLNHNDRWLALIPVGTDVTITGTPDSAHRSQFAYSSGYFHIDSTTSDPYYVYIPITGRGAVEGIVTDDTGEPAESTLVRLGLFYSTYSDIDGHYVIQNVPSNENLQGSPYKLVFYKPGYVLDTIPVYVLHSGITHIDHQLTNIDSIPPYGTLHVGNAVAKHTTLYFTAIDTFTQFGDTLPPEKVMVRDNNSSWQIFQYGLSFDHNISWTMHTTTNYNEVDTLFVKFVDYARNESDSLVYPVIVDQEGPHFTYSINNGDSVTLNPEIRITDLSVTSTVSPVKTVLITEHEKDGVRYPYHEGDTYSFTLSNIPGQHVICVYLIDSLGVTSAPVYDTITLDYYGTLAINHDSAYTNSSTVNLDFEDVGGIVASNANYSGTFGNYPLAQSFTPHTDSIMAISLYLSRGAKVGICVDSVDEEGNHSPGRILVLDTLDHGGEINLVYSTPIPVNPDSSYMIIIFKDSLGEYSNDIITNVGDDQNYGEGHLYYSPMKKGLFWYETGYDLVFSVRGTVDSMRISNDPSFNSGTGWIPFSSHYPNWILSTGEGLRTVYAQVMSNTDVRTYHDAIMVDYTPPDTAWAELLNHVPYLETTECTLRLFAFDGGTGIKDFKINDYPWTPVHVSMPFIQVFNIDSGAPGPRTISVIFRDQAGNEYHVPEINIDYDPHGPTGTLQLGSGIVSSETVDVFIHLDKFKEKSIPISRMRYSEDRRHWSEWTNYSSHFTHIFHQIGTVSLSVELEDIHGKRGILMGSCLIDTVPPETPFNLRDEGDSTMNHDSLYFSWRCYGDYLSGLDHFTLKISRSPDVSHGIISFEIPGNLRSYKVGGLTLRGDSTYYAKIIAFDRAGLYSESQPTDGIRVVNGIRHFHLISPQDSSIISSGDSITLVWHRAHDIISHVMDYRVFIDSQSVALVTDTFWIVNFTISNGWHRWYVVARDSLLDRRSSDTLYFHVGSFNPPPTPTAISPSDTAFNYDTVRFVWSPGDKKAPVKIVAKRKGHEQKDDAIITAFYGKQNITYHIEVSHDSTFSTIGTTGDTEDTTIVLTVPEGILWWRVSAVNEGGASDWSLPLRFIVDTTPPTIPVPIAPLDTLYTTDIQFTWHASTDDLTGLMYYIFTCWSQGGFLEADTLTDTTITLNLGAGDYLYTVIAMDSVGNVSESDTNRLYVRPVTLPTPVLVSPPNDTIMAVVNYITFSWAPGKGSTFLNGKDGAKKYRRRVGQLVNSFSSKDYMYEIRFSHDSLFTDIGIVDTTSATSIIENLWEGYVYWQIRAIDSSGNISLWSNPWRLVLDTTRPQVPYLVYPPDSAVIETNSVHFIWRSSSDFTGIDHYLLGYEHRNGDTSEFYSITTTDTERVVNGLENGEWNWYVNAYDSAGNYKFSGYRHFTISYLPPLPVPTIIHPTGNQWLPTLVVFKWRIDSTKSQGEKDTYYFIVQVMSGEPVFTDTVAGDTLFTFLPSGNYTWHVRTYQNGRTSDWSPIDSFRVDGYAPNPPEPISPCNGCYINTLSVDFVWSSTTDSLSGLAGYRLTIADNPDMINPVLDTLLQDTTFSMSGLYEGEWYWQVGGEDSVGNYASYDIQVFYIDTTPPEPVILVSPPDSFLYGFGDLPVFIWHPTEGLIKKMGKEVYYELWITDGDTLVYPELVDTSLWMDTLLADGWYNWFVRAYDEHGNFSQSEVRVFGFDNTPPVIESTTVIHDTSYRGPYLIRTYAYDENGLSYIKLFYGFNERLTDSVPMTADTIPDHYYCYIPTIPDSFTDTVRVTYYIMALDNAYEPNEAYAPSDSAYVFHVYPVGVNESVPPSKFSILTRSIIQEGRFEFIVSVPVTGIVDITLYCIDGRKMFHMSKSLNTGYHKVILSRLVTNGVYFVEAKYNKVRIIRKVIVVK